MARRPPQLRQGLPGTPQAPEVAPPKARVKRPKLNANDSADHLFFLLSGELVHATVVFCRTLDNAAAARGAAHAPAQGRTERITAALALRRQRAPGWLRNASRHSWCTGDTDDEWQRLECLRLAPLALRIVRAAAQQPTKLQAIAACAVDVPIARMAKLGQGVRLQRVIDALEKRLVSDGNPDAARAVVVVGQCVASNRPGVLRAMFAVPGASLGHPFMHQGIRLHVLKTEILLRVARELDRTADFHEESVSLRPSTSFVRVIAGERFDTRRFAYACEVLAEAGEADPLPVADSRVVAEETTAAERALFGLASAICEPLDHAGDLSAMDVPVARLPAASEGGADRGSRVYVVWRAFSGAGDALTRSGAEYNRVDKHGVAEDRTAPERLCRLAWRAMGATSDQAHDFFHLRPKSKRRT